MKKSPLIIVLLISILCFKINAIAQIIVPINPIVMTRVDTFGPGIPGNAPVALTVTLKKSTGFLTQTQSRTFAANANQTVNFTNFIGLNGIKFSVSLGGLSSQGIYYLPTALNETTVIPATDCGMMNIAGQYGYSVSITNTGPSQYVVRPVKLFCHLCIPCNPPTLTKSK